MEFSPTPSPASGPSWALHSTWTPAPGVYLQVLLSCPPPVHKPVLSAARPPLSLPHVLFP